VKIEIDREGEVRRRRAILMTISLTEDNNTDNSHLKPAGPSLIQVLFWQPFSVG